ncbi:MAG: 3-dehydroquinate synthase [Spirochaetaceae bacterium]|jgi:3-dehydroquinate synthase|nr:3-dehydroquinate synthase [Spirochaetaceae bacterium]
MNYDFTFGRRKSSVHIEQDIPGLDGILAAIESERAVLVCDTNTVEMAEVVRGGAAAAVCVLPYGENTKNWQSVEKILRVAAEAGLDRDGLFVAVGGGLVSDLCAFAASVYKRGAGLVIVSTTLLGMVDAALGGKTGFDMLGIRNFAGTFYPAPHIYMPLAALGTLPPREWRSGLAEIIKTLVLDDSFYAAETRGRLLALKPALSGEGTPTPLIEAAASLIARSVAVKGRIVQNDPEERGGERMLLNLGHTFAHALESAAGLGRLSHGEAVAWGLSRACALGEELGITPPERAEAVRAVLEELDYETGTPHPALVDSGAFVQALKSDKKKTRGLFRFVVPAGWGACIVTINNDSLNLIEKISGLA